ncbi:GNAT family N-acetyltransferase [Aspergillus germanicus]
MRLTRQTTLEKATTAIFLAMNADAKVELCRVRDDARAISAVANTITISFANDPLIEWLRPRAPAWSIDQPDTFKWQYRRIQRTMVQGIALQSAPALQKDQDHNGFRGSGLSDVSTPLLRAAIAQDTKPLEDAGAAVLLFPPPGRHRWTLRRLLLRLKLWCLDIFDPISEEGANTQRLETMMATHEKTIARVKTEYNAQDAWYLEVVAVHPSLQGRGLGKRAMRSVLDFVQDEPVILECTRESNVGFYRSLGFEVVEEVELVDGGDTVKLWLMLRQTPKTEDAS